MQASRNYLEDHCTPGKTCSEDDRRLLEQGIDLGNIILKCKPWQSLAQVHEMGIFVEDFPEEARQAWALTEREGTEPLLSGATQMIKVQEWVDDHTNKDFKEMVHALSRVGANFLRKLWSQEGQKMEDRLVVEDQLDTGHRNELTVKPSGMPKLTQKQTVSRVKTASILNKTNGAQSMQMLGLEGCEGCLAICISTACTAVSSTNITSGFTS